MRVYKKRTNRESVSEDAIKSAIGLVLKNRDKKGFSIRSVAKMHKISYTTLSRYIKKCKQAIDLDDEEMDSSDGNDDFNVEWRKIPGQVLNREHEALLIDYIDRCSRINFALRPKHTRYLAYQYAVKLDINRPSSWDKNKRAGEDWLTSFLRRNESLLPFSSQAMRSRTASFNKLDAKKFYDTLEELYERQKIVASNIYNMSESSVTAVVVPSAKPLTQKSCGKSIEKSPEAICVAVAANAVGNIVPPMLIFPRKKYHQRFVQDGPANCIGAGNPSGSMTDETFVTFVRHFVKHAKRDESNNCLLLIMDNMSTAHLSIPALDLCSKEGVTLLSIPPHCTQKLQPLQVAASRAFKDYCKMSMDDWLSRYLGKKMTVHDLPAIIKEPLASAMTPENISLGFAKTGIYPFRRQNFDTTEEHVAYQQPSHEAAAPTPINNLPMEYPDFGHLM